MSQLTISCPSLYAFLIGMLVQFLIFLWYSTLVKLLEVTSEQLQWRIVEIINVPYHGYQS